MTDLPDWLRNPLEQWERTWHNHTTEAPVTKQEHDQQRARVQAADRLSPDPAERRNVYPIRRRSTGWSSGQQTPPRPPKPPAA